MARFVQMAKQAQAKRLCLRMEYASIAAEHEARLIACSSSLENLEKQHASTMQVLNEQKAKEASAHFAEVECLREVEELRKALADAEVKLQLKQSAAFEERRLHEKIEYQVQELERAKDAALHDHLAALMAKEELHAEITTSKASYHGLIAAIKERQDCLE
ncbi:hypothetical protein AMTR_s00012p00216870 [Amborella trichopoda]|uniref:Uncharacterized protein n=1 Tax=Amborella trichopoda TaxID=13333 RepID=W1PD71_AMBTC|nr:hypothetical protein AMTR_s00012p00216870 [Amborella trichopoda]